MELEELKQKWQAQEQHLNENLRLNSEILKQVHFSRINSTFKYMGVAEFLNLVVIVIVLIFYTRFTIQYCDDMLYFTFGAATLAIALVYFVLSSIEWIGYLKITSSNDSVLKKQKAVLTQMKRVAQFFVFEVALTPLFIAVAAPMLILLRGYDVRSNFTYYLITIIIISILSIVLCMVLYRYYVKKFKNAEAELKSIEEYEK